MKRDSVDRRPELGLNLLELNIRPPQPGTVSAQAEIALPQRCRVGPMKKLITVYGKPDFSAAFDNLHVVRHSLAAVIGIGFGEEFEARIAADADTRFG